MCGTAMPQVNSEANTPPGAPAWCISSQTITRVGAVAATAADGFREGGARAGPAAPALRCSVARQLAGAFPLVDVRQDLAFGERAHRLAQLLAFRVSIQMLTAARPPGCRRSVQRSHSPSPLACGSNRA